MIDVTIDEAIEKEKFKARVDRIKANKRIFHNNDKDEINACNRSAEEHEQIAEWLEELRATSCGYSKEDIELNRNAMYNKAIDDFADKIISLCWDGEFMEQFNEFPATTILELAEQLKESKVK